MADSERKLPKEQLSKTPSWIMLGFVLGGLFAFTIRPHSERVISAAAPPKQEEIKPVAKTPPLAPILTTIEAVFADWGQYALWENERTEIAMWDMRTNSFTDYYEVLRDGDVYYFRSISRLTRPLVREGTRMNCPLQFTEPEDMRRARLERGYLAPPEWLEKRPPTTVDLPPRTVINPGPAEK
jgi:hypothetical protein